VPAGRGERFDWVTSLTPEQIDAIVAAFEHAKSTIDCFRYGGGA
jgi:hypothetical protein